MERTAGLTTPTPQPSPETGMIMRISEKEIDSEKSPNGGWSREQLAKRGIPWPPPRGWKKGLMKKEEDDAVRSNPA